MLRAALRRAAGRAGAGALLTRRACSGWAVALRWLPCHGRACSEARLLGGACTERGACSSIIGGVHHYQQGRLGQGTTLPKGLRMCIGKAGRRAWAGCTHCRQPLALASRARHCAITYHSRYRTSMPRTLCPASSCALQQWVSQTAVYIRNQWEHHNFQMHAHNTMTGKHCPYIYELQIYRIT